MIADPAAMSVLAPDDLAELLGLDRADAGLLSTAPVRVPAPWPASWRTRLGPLELSLDEVVMLTGRPARTLRHWCLKGWLRCRRAGGKRMVAPAALVECLRRCNADAPPEVAETPTQQRRRFARDKEEAAALCGGGRSKRRSAR